MLGRRQGEVAPTRKVALKIEMPPLRPTGAKPTLGHPAFRVVPHPRRRTFEPAMVDRMPRFRP